MAQNRKGKKSAPSKTKAAHAVAKSPSRKRKAADDDDDDDGLNDDCDNSVASLPPSKKPAKDILATIEALRVTMSAPDDPPPMWADDMSNSEIVKRAAIQELIQMSHGFEYDTHRDCFGIPTECARTAHDTIVSLLTKNPALAFFMGHIEIWEEPSLWLCKTIDILRARIDGQI